MKVAFLDRDGVINQEVNYLHRIEDFRYTNRCIEALTTLVQLDFKLVIVTNQAGIARGYYSESEYSLLTNWFCDDLRERGVTILDVLYCPHHPEGNVKKFAKVCDCRKPKPGMILDAVKRYSVDLKQSIMVGDKLSDIHAARRAGVDRAMLVESGHPLPSSCHDSCEIFKDLYELSLFLFYENSVTT